MRWSKSGARLLLQARTRVLNGALGTKFRFWHPGLDAANTDQGMKKAAA